MLCNRRKNSFNIIAEIAARRAHHRHILCKAVAVAVADEFARDAREINGDGDEKQQPNARKIFEVRSGRLPWL